MRGSLLAALLGVSVTASCAETEQGDSCFSAHTMILTPHGPVGIETLRPDDEVLSLDHATGEVVVRKVVRSVVDRGAGAQLLRGGDPGAQ